MAIVSSRSNRKSEVGDVRFLVKKPDGFTFIRHAKVIKNVVRQANVQNVIRMTKDLYKKNVIVPKLAR